MFFASRHKGSTLAFNDSNRHGVPAMQLRSTTLAILAAVMPLEASAVLVTNGDFYTPDATVYSVAAPSGWLANDSSSDGGLRVISFTLPSQGLLNVATDGSFTFTPGTGQTSNTVVTYTATDDSGTTSSAMVTFDLVSTLPTAVNDFYTPTSTVLTVAAPGGWLANDTGGIGSLHAVSFLAPSQGVVNAATDGSFTYTPASGQTTNETITYTMRDDLNRLSSASVTFDLESTLPVAVDDFFSILAGDILDIGPPGLLANDFSGVGSLSVVSFTTISDGLLSLLTDGSVTFAPNAGFIGTTMFSYTMRDALGRFSTAMVEIEVQGNAVPVPPAAALMVAGLVAMRRRFSQLG